MKGLRNSMMLPELVAVASIAIAGHACATEPPSYLFVWAGDADAKANDFLGVIDVTPGSDSYGKIVASIATDERGTHPHHTEHSMPADGHLLANGFHAGRTWLFDLTQPLTPRILTSFGDLAGFSHPHTFIRMENGHVLTTFQYASTGPSAATGHILMPDGDARRTGGLVEMDERGAVMRSGSAEDDSIADRQLYPYSILPMPAFDRALSTTTDMDPSNKAATSQWVQLWRLSDLKLLRSIALEPGPRGDENQLTGEPRLLPDGRGVYLHTFMCGLYLIRGVESDAPTARFVHGFTGTECGVPVLTGHYWLQTVPDEHAVISLDISNPEEPRVVSTVKVNDGERPHWISIDSAGRRVVLNSGGYSKSNRLYLLNFDPATGQLSLDEKFRDAKDELPGINMTGSTWPHGFNGKAAPHGAVFSR